jgi:tetratricopeptide (TPR) repeat protein
VPDAPRTSAPSANEVSTSIGVRHTGNGNVVAQPGSVIAGVLNVSLPPKPPRQLELPIQHGDSSARAAAVGFTVVRRTLVEAVRQRVSESVHAAKPCLRRPVFVRGLTGSGKTSLAGYVHERAIAARLMRVWLDARASLVDVCGELIGLIVDDEQQQRLNALMARCAVQEQASQIAQSQLSQQVERLSKDVVVALARQLQEHLKLGAVAQSGPGQSDSPAVECDWLFVLDDVSDAEVGSESAVMKLVRNVAASLPGCGVVLVTTQSDVSEIGFCHCDVSVGDMSPAEAIGFLQSDICARGRDRGLDAGFVCEHGADLEKLASEVDCHAQSLAIVSAMVVQAKSVQSVIGSLREMRRSPSFGAFMSQPILRVGGTRLGGRPNHWLAVCSALKCMDGGALSASGEWVLCALYSIALRGRAAVPHAWVDEWVTCVRDAVRREAVGADAGWYLEAATRLSLVRYDDEERAWRMHESVRTCVAFKVEEASSAHWRERHESSAVESTSQRCVGDGVWHDGLRELMRLAAELCLVRLANGELVDASGGIVWAVERLKVLDLCGERVSVELVGGLHRAVIAAVHSTYRYAEAERILDAVGALERRLSSDGRAEHASVTTRLRGELAHARRRFAAAVPLLEAAVREGSTPVQRGEAQYKLGMCYVSWQRVEEAEAALQAAHKELMLCECERGLYLRSLVSQARRHNALFTGVSAPADVQGSAIAVGSKEFRAGEFALCGQAALQRGEFDRANELFESALAIYESVWRGEPNLWCASVLLLMGRVKHSQAVVSHELSLLGDARLYAQRASAMAQKASGGGDHDLLASCEMLFSDLCTAANQHEVALQHDRKAADINRALGRSHSEGVALFRCAQSLVALHKEKLAQEHAERALALLGSWDPNQVNCVILVVTLALAPTTRRAADDSRNLSLVVRALEACARLQDPRAKGWRRDLGLLQQQLRGLLGGRKP